MFWGQRWGGWCGKDVEMAECVYGVSELVNESVNGAARSWYI